MRLLRHAAGGALGVEPRSSSVRGRSLSLRWSLRHGCSDDLGLARGAQSPPHDDAFDRDVDRDSIGVVLPQPAIPETSPLWGSHEALGGRAQNVLEPVRVGLLDDGRAALDEDEKRVAREAVITRVIRERDARVGLQTLQFPAESERCREADGAAVAVPQTHRCDRRHDRSAGRRSVRHSGRQIASDDRIDFVGPCHGFGVWRLQHLDVLNVLGLETDQSNTEVGSKTSRPGRTEGRGKHDGVTAWRRRIIAPRAAVAGPVAAVVPRNDPAKWARRRAGGGALCSTAAGRAQLLHSGVSSADPIVKIERLSRSRPLRFGFGAVK